MRSTGFSLVESLIAGALAVLLILPLSALFQQSRMDTELSLNEIRASLLAREVVDQIQTLKYVMGFDRLSPISSHRKSAPFLELAEWNDAPLYGSKAGRSFSKLYLSPLPPGYRRLIKIYPSNLGPDESRYLASPNLITLEVRMEWKTMYSQVYNRHISLLSILARDDIFPEF